MSKQLVGGLACLTSLAALAAVPGAGLAKGPVTTGAYIVQLKAEPVASYTGGTAGIPATSPKTTGTRRSLESAGAQRYRAYLDRVQDRALARAPGASGRVIYRYRTAFAGFAARLTPAQVRDLRAAPEVARVEADTLSKEQSITRTSPAAVNIALGGANGSSGVGGDGASYLGLPNGLWNRLGGPDTAGQGIVVGVIDSGLQRGHPSFADTASGNYQGPDYPATRPQGWGGICQEGSVPGPSDGWTTSDCNNKVIGARYFVEGFGTQNLGDGSRLSPGDDDGHGSHTAATAAGNFGVRPQIAGNDLGFDTADDVISGIAPRAFVSVYKVCWEGETEDDAGCSNADSVEAIDRAVADGVDVINYSVGSDTSTVFGATENAYLGASDAGVFVANSAGNAGPEESTVGSPASVPWLTTVGASTLARTFRATATVGGVNIAGESVTGALPVGAPVVDAATSGRAGIDPDEAGLCFAGTLDPAKVTGKVVLCERGVNARIAKSKEVDDARGVGMILANPSAGQDTETDTHWVPTIHVSKAQGDAVRATIDDNGASVTASTAGTRTPATGAELAAFSSRGPQSAVPDLLKPDVVAPGVNILAAASDAPAESSGLRPGQLFQAISGTSMASPHVAGAAALLKQAHPSFDPAEIKSALVTTADPAVSDPVKGAAVATTFAKGAGEIDPTAAAEVGLVLDARTGDYLAYLSGVAPELFDGASSDTRPVDLNLPSISFSELTGRDSTTRTFTSVDPATREWTVSTTGLPGFDVETDAPEGKLIVRAGATATLAIQLTRTSAQFGTAEEGALLLTNGGRTVRVPITAVAQTVSAQRTVEISADTSAGSADLPVRSGFPGAFSALGWGLAAPSSSSGSIARTTGDPAPTGADPGTQLYPVTVPAGSQLLAARISGTQDPDATDLDLFVYTDANGDGRADDPARPVLLSASGGSDETVTEVLPAAGRYLVAVTAYDTGTGPKTYTLTTWVATDGQPDDPSPAPGLTVTGEPGTVAAGDELALKANWSGVDKPGVYLGVATYHQGATPTLDNLEESSIVELTKTRDTTPVVVAPPGTTPAPPPAPAPRPPVVTPRVPKVSVAAARVLGRRVSFSFTAYSTVKVKVTLKRGARTVASSRTSTVKAGRRRLAVTVPRRLAKGTYKVSVRVTTAAGRRTTRTLTLRVR